MLVPDVIVAALIALAVAKLLFGSVSATWAKEVNEKMKIDKRAHNKRNKLTEGL